MRLLARRHAKVLPSPTECPSVQEGIALPLLSPLLLLPTELPLFPLHIALFPGGLLPLRIFGAHYMGIVRTCLCDRTSFGVCLTERGNEVTTADGTAIPIDAGCIAHIVECDMGQLGLLMIRMCDAQRLKVLSLETMPDGLVRGTIEPIDTDVEGCKSELFDDRVDTLRRVATALDSREDGNAPMVEPYEWNSLSWVVNRLRELLPVPFKARWKLMELMDADMRIEIVYRRTKQHHTL